MTRADDLRGFYLTTRPELDEAGQRNVALTVAEHSRDADDARDLLAVLGLIDPTPLQALMSCGHPRTSLRRRPTRNGVECIECHRARQRILDAKARRQVKR